MSKILNKEKIDKLSTANDSVDASATDLSYSTLEQQEILKKYFIPHPEKYDPLFQDFFPRLEKALSEMEEDDEENFKP
jgi:hypothetical protein